jgi:D-arginine dehydrogenase
VPILREDRLAGAALDGSGLDIDVAALHQGCVRAVGRAGARLVTGARATALERGAGLWHVRTRAGDFAAPVVVNAAGAWADEVARQAGVGPLGLQPMRRTAIGLPPPPGHDIRAWPLAIDVDESFYFKPEAGPLLLSPANEDPSSPCDAVADELDVAIAIDRYERATTMAVTRIAHRRAGLRSFFADRTPVVGFDLRATGFFWLRGRVAMASRPRRRWRAWWQHCSTAGLSRKTSRARASRRTCWRRRALRWRAAERPAAPARSTRWSDRPGTGRTVRRA